VIRILGHAARTGYEDYFVEIGVRVWLLGWFLRVVVQVVFFALIGRLLGSEEQVRYLLIGNAVMLAAVGALLSVAGTTWERRAGTLPLLVVISMGALLIVAPIFDVSLPWARMPLVVPLVVVVALSTYALGTFLGGLVLHAMSTRNIVSNLAQTTMMAICGVNVPLSYYPDAVQWLAHALPLTHGLLAIRELLAGAGGATVLAYTGAELLVGLGWLALALLTFDRLAEHGRRDGSIELAV